tara:strand:- start:2552 stop:2683 length:132 start_codon:yes stop_codon:yes gene_type:complete
MACGCGRKKNIRAVAKSSYRLKASARMKRNAARLKNARKKERN